MADIPILLVGGGGHCRACIDVIELVPGYEIAGIVEQPGREGAPPVLGYPVLGSDGDLEKLRQTYDHALVTIGQIGPPGARYKAFCRLKALGFTLPVLVSPLARVSPHAVIEKGTVVMHQALVNAGARVGRNCIINTGALVEHDACIGDHTHISTRAVVNGGAGVGAGSFMGSNAVLVQGVVLPENQFVKACALITKP
ncbi:MAG: NeuD/PglB/VioB family sugar acetyltransferase [Desulfobacter sp.]|nr:MAG: NeuD/PglB/VioB family sugar acetyltransferase [Desulfobacter sp.]